MNGSYYLDLRKISLNQFQKKLQKQDLLPSRKILQENMAENFQIIASRNIYNLEQLRKALSSKEKISAFAQESGLPEPYLTILRREVNSYHPNPVKLNKFPGVKPKSVKQLAQMKITNSRHLFDQSQTIEQRRALSTRSGVGRHALQELIDLSDLVRISGVGPVFARMLYECGIQSCASLSRAKPKALFRQLIEFNQRIGITKAGFSQKDVAYCIKFAQMIT